MELDIIALQMYEMKLKPIAAIVKEEQRLLNNSGTSEN